MSKRLQKKRKMDDYWCGDMDDSELQPTVFMDPLNLPENKKSFVLVSREREENLQAELKSINKNVSEIFRMMAVMSNHLTTLNVEVASIKSQLGQQGMATLPVVIAPPNLNLSTPVSLTPQPPLANKIVLPSTVAAQGTATPSNPPPSVRPSAIKVTPLRPVEQKPKAKISPPQRPKPMVLKTFDAEEGEEQEQEEERVPSPLIIEETITEDDEEFLIEAIDYIEESDSPGKYAEVEESVPEQENRPIDVKMLKKVQQLRNALKIVQSQEAQKNRNIRWPIDDHEEFLKLQNQMLEDDSLREALVVRFSNPSFRNIDLHFGPNVFTLYSAAGQCNMKKIKDTPLLMLLAESLVTPKTSLNEIIGEINKNGRKHRHRICSREMFHRKKREKTVIEEFVCD